MPYMLTLVESELVMSHNGVDIYHVYKDNDVENGARAYSYTTDIYGLENGAAAFDIRDIVTKLQIYPNGVIDLNEKFNHEVFIKLAIDLGTIKHQCD